MNKDKLVIRKCTIEDADNIMELQSQVFKDIGENSTLLRRNTRDMFLLCCKEPNITLGLYDPEQNNKLVGVGIAVDASGTEEDLSLNLQKHDASGLRSCNLKLVMIRQEYYGLGFQKYIVSLLERLMQMKGYQCICSTVSPDNIYSRNNFERLGYTVDHEELKYGGLARLVYYKKFMERATVKFIPLKAEQEDKILEMSKMATVIVKEYFDPLIGAEQNDYMISLFQSPEAIREQIKHGYRYYFVKSENASDHFSGGQESLGFLAFYPRGKSMYLSKFYLYKNQRGKGYSRQMFRFVVEQAEIEGLNGIELNVNRHNGACKVYEKLGMFILREEKNDIGNGFFMDDYVYRFNISSLN